MRAAAGCWRAVGRLGRQGVYWRPACRRLAWWGRGGGAGPRPRSATRARIRRGGSQAMHLTFAHYRNRFCMFRTYYALAQGIVQPKGFTMSVIEVTDPPSHVQEEALIADDVQVANLYFPNFLRCKVDGAPIVGIAT